MAPLVGYDLCPNTRRIRIVCSSFGAQEEAVGAANTDLYAALCLHITMLTPPFAPRCRPGGLIPRRHFVLTQTDYAIQL